jgi:hypothetical protein
MLVLQPVLVEAVEVVGQALLEVVVQVVVVMVQQQILLVALVQPIQEVVAEAVVGHPTQVVTMVDLVVLV